MLDAAIIGGGPVGLATAAALLQATEPVLNVKVRAKPRTFQKHLDLQKPTQDRFSQTALHAQCCLRGPHAVSYIHMCPAAPPSKYTIHQ